ncbi:MAG: SWIM zinc finger domain-containing protein [Acholeplasmataceae bacterium]
MAKRMDLFNFESFFEEDALSEGKAFFLEGRVSEVEFYEDYFEAKVLESDVFTVRIQLKEDTKVQWTSCDCAEKGLCKHEAAVLYQLLVVYRDDGFDEVQETALRIENLKRVLSEKKAPELVAILIDLAGQSKAIRNRLLYEHTKTMSREDEVELCRQIMVEHFEDLEAFEEDEYLDDSELEAMLSGVRTVLRSMKSHDDPITAVTVYLLALELTRMICSYGENPDTLFTYEKDILKGIERLLARQLSESEQDEALDLLIDGAIRDLDEGEEQGFHLFDLAVLLAGSPKRRTKLEQILSRIETDQETKDEKALSERIDLIRYRLIATYDSYKRAQEFFAGRTENEDMRALAIEKAIENEALDEALELARTGMERFDRARFRDYAYRIHRIREDRPEVREMSRSFLMEGRAEYFADFLSCYRLEDHERVIEQLLDDMEKERAAHPAYESILIQRDLRPRMLEYCQKEPMRILRLYGYLGEGCDARIDELFIRAIENKADQANRIEAYADILGDLAIYGKHCGIERRQALVERLIDRMKRRPAFVDRLIRLRESGSSSS